MNVLGKIISWLFLLTVIPAFSNAFAEMRYGNFLPNSEILYDIYGHLPSYQIESSYVYKKHCAFFGNLSLIHSRGYSIPLRNRSDLYYIPLSLGVKYIPMNYEKFAIQFGIGTLPSYLITKDYSEYVKKHNSKMSFGVIFKMESALKIAKKFNLSFFSDYQAVKFKFPAEESTGLYVETFDIDFSGWTLGVGISNFF